MIAAAGACEPLLELLREQLRRGPKLQVDETTVQVLKEPGRSTALGKAIAFALGQWPKLIRYLDHSQLTPDNNSCEQASRPFVIGRRNWLFSGSPRGATAQRTALQLDRDRQGERVRTVLVPA